MGKEFEAHNGEETAYIEIQENGCINVCCSGRKWEDEDHYERQSVLWADFTKEQAEEIYQELGRILHPEHQV
jgi:hypothetical protein